MYDIKEIIAYPVKLVLLYRFKRIIKANCNSKIFLVDIDNTLGDSWHSLKLTIWQNENERLKYLAIFLGMRKMLKDIMCQEKTFIIYFTARNLFSRNVTINWLQNNGLPVKNNNLVITRIATWKIDFLKKINLANYNITYIDDLSHKHEKGEIVFFTKEIAEINLLEQKFPQNFTYINAKQINTINGL